MFVSFDSMTYVIHYSRGKIKHEGKGLSFHCYRPTSSIVAIPLASRDVPFIFQETSKDFQKITFQGQMTYNIHDPKALSEALDFTTRDGKLVRSDRFEVLDQRLNNEAQTAVSAFIQGKNLREGLRTAQEVSKLIKKGLVMSDVIQFLGVQILSVEITSITPTPEMAKALETEAHENIQKEADQAIYERRNFAVEQERKIRESELNTEIAVQEKQKEINKKTAELKYEQAQAEQNLRTMKLESDIKAEQKNKELVQIKTENIKKLADAQGYKIAKTLDPYKNIDYHVLMALSNKGNSSADNISMAFRELAERSEKIGTLNITPDLLSSLTKEDSDEDY